MAKLEQGGFRLWEDRIEQKIEYFASEDIPQTVGILFDVSGSMHNKITVAQEAVAIGLQSQYVLGFIPTNTNKDGKWRKISLKVELDRKSTRLNSSH